MGSPCLMPLFAWKKPLMIIEKCTEDRHLLVHSLHLLPKPFGHKA